MRGIRLTSVVLPEPVGPTIARLLPAGIVKIYVLKDRNSVIRKIKMAELNLAAQ